MLSSSVNGSETIKNVVTSDFKNRVFFAIKSFKLI